MTSTTRPPLFAKCVILTPITDIITGSLTSIHQGSDPAKRHKRSPMKNKKYLQRNVAIHTLNDKIAYHIVSLVCVFYNSAI